MRCQGVRELSLFPTRIVDFKVEPTLLPVGSNAKVTGKLQWYCNPIMCPPFGSWQPYQNATVEIYVDSTKVGEVQTKSGGGFEYDLYFDKTGTYVIYAHYPGSWKDDECWSTKITVRVVSKEDYKREKEIDTILYLIAGVLTGTAIMMTVWIVTRR